MALALSAYLSWHYLAGGSLVGCGGGSSCDELLSGRWSTVGGVVPVSGLAVGAYLAMLVASLYIGPGTEAPVRRLAWRAMQVLAGAAAASAVWFTVVQKWLIGSFCPYCMATHITGLLLAALLIWRTPGQLSGDSSAGALPNPAPAPGARKRMVRRFHAIRPAAVGVACAGILAVCQVAFVPRAVYRGGQSQGNLRAVDPHSVPLMGSPDAPYVVALLFDYKCPHCQQLHFLLDEAVRRYGGKLAFALCPTPLNPRCNPYVPREVDEFKDSCELAKIGLAVWIAKRDAFPAFDRWMFTLESGDRWRPRSPDAAKAKAAELVGQANFAAALADPRVDQYLQTFIRIYGEAGGGPVPKLVFGSRWVTPQLYDPGDIVVVLHNSLGVPPP